MNDLSPALSSPRPFLVLLALGSSVLISRRLIAGAVQSRDEDLLHYALSVTGGMLLSASVLAVLLWLFGGAGGIVFLMVLFNAGFLFAQRKASQRRALVGVLAVAAEHGMPLVPALNALAQECPRALAGPLDRVIVRLERGDPLANALHEARRAAPALLTAAAAVGARHDCLREALGVVASEQSEHRKTIERAIQHWGYLFVVLFVTSMVYAYVRIQVVPRLEAIYTDFDSQLNGLSAASWTLAFHPLTSWAMGVVVIPMLLIAGLVSLLSLSHPNSQWAIQRYFWRLPMRGALKLMALGVERQGPLLGVINLVADHYPGGRLRSRVRRAAVVMREGMPWQEALHQQQLVSSAQAGVLRASERVGNLPWGLRAMADSLGRTQLARFQFLERTFTTCFLLTLAVWLLIFGLAVLLPLWDLMGQQAIWEFGT